ncbi:MAG: short-chain dehydrogenase [Chloroflexi bacterium]|nr:short-chain dehydrogenase [Chloroflexota bacterium]
MRDLEGKTAIVTGGGLGIGSAGAKELASQGAAVTIMDIDESAAESTSLEIRSAGGKTIVVIGDASSSSDCDRCVSDAVSAFGGLDILFNNVGIQPVASYANVENTTEEMWDRILSVNLKSRFLMAKYSIPEMRKRGGGVIISTASVQGQQSAHLVPAYAATKGGDLSLTRQLALDYAEENIRVLSVCPGGVDTPLWRDSVLSSGKNVEDAIVESGITHPIGRLGAPEDIAKVVAFLASDKASFMTGTFVNVDGGIMAKGSWA